MKLREGIVFIRVCHSVQCVCVCVCVCVRQLCIMPCTLLYSIPLPESGPSLPWTWNADLPGSPTEDMRHGTPYGPRPPNTEIWRLRPETYSNFITWRTLCFLVKFMNVLYTFSIYTDSPLSDRFITVYTGTHNKTLPPRCDNNHILFAKIAPRTCERSRYGLSLAEDWIWNGLECMLMSLESHSSRFMRHYHGIQLGFVPHRSHRLSKHKGEVKFYCASLEKDKIIYKWFFKKLQRMPYKSNRILNTNVDLVCKLE